MRILLMRTLQLQQRIFSTFICRSTAIQQKNWTAISTIHSPAGRFKSLINEFPCFQSKRLSSSFPHNENENGPNREFFDGYYFIGEIPRDRIAHKWSKASGPGGSNVNANPTKAEIRFNLSEADWIPELVRERIAQKYKGYMNSRGEFRLTSMQTRTAAENLEDCFERLAEILREVSLDLVKERRREYIPQEYLDKLERRKEFAERRRIAEKKKIGHRREGKRDGLY